MIQFNLLPDVKVKYVKAERTKLLVISLSLIVSFVSIAILAAMYFYVDVVQKKSINKINSDINTNISSINSNTNLNKILTIQNQANKIPTLQSQLVQSSRVFTFMAQLTPLNASITNLATDFNKNQISITGQSDTLTTVNQFVDTLKFATYSNYGKNVGLAFSNVLLDSFSYASGTQPVYNITLNFDHNIFLQKNSIVLNVPTQTTTRSIIDQPTNLFEKAN